MVQEYKWNPFDDISFDYSKEVTITIKDKIDRLTDEDIKNSIICFEKYLEIGKWPLDDTLMHQLRDELKLNESEEHKEGSLIQLYNMIAQEACRRFILNEK